MPPSVHHGMWFHYINHCSKASIQEEREHQVFHQQKDVVDATWLVDFEIFERIVQPGLYGGWCHVKNDLLLLHIELELSVACSLVIVVIVLG